jgi:hypothetical protein
MMQLEGFKPKVKPEPPKRHRKKRRYREPKFNTAMVFGIVVKPLVRNITLKPIPRLCVRANYPASPDFNRNAIPRNTVALKVRIIPKTMLWAA